MKQAKAYMSLVYSEKPELWKTDLCPIGKVREWTESGEERPLPAWLNKEEHTIHTSILLKKGFTGPLNWYKQSIAGVTTKHEGELSDEVKTITVPVFYIGAQKDYVGLEAQARASTQQWSKGGFETTSIDAGHWVYIEKRKEYDEALKGWLEKTYSSGSKI